MKKTFVSNGDAKGYVGVVCSGSKQKNNNGEWRRRLWILNSKILPTGNVRLAAFCPPRSSCPGTQVVHAHRLVGVLIGTSFLFYGHLFLWLTNLSDPQTTGPHTSNPNQVGDTLCISIAFTTLFGGYLRFAGTLFLKNSAGIPFFFKRRVKSNKGVNLSSIPQYGEGFKSWPLHGY